MEALAVVGVVSSIVQLVNFSSKILSTGIELYKSADGVLANNMTVEQVTKDLIALDKSLNESIRATAESSCLTDETALKSLAEKCKEVSAELLGRLESLKISEKHNPGALYAKHSEVCGKGEDGCNGPDFGYDQAIAEPSFVGVFEVGHLHFHEMHIGKQMMETFRRTLNSVSTEQSEDYQRLDGRTQAIVDAVREGRSCFDDSFQESALGMEELHRETQTLNIGEHEKTRAEIASA